MNIKKILAVLLLVAAAGTITALAHRDQDTTGDGKLRVTASYYPLYDFAKQVGGNDITAANIAGNNEPHDFDPSPQAIISAQKSAVFIYNGGHLEPWVDGFLQDYTHVAVKASEHITLQHTADEDESNNTVSDPHFWLDPVLAQQTVRSIRDGLSKADPAHATEYQDRANTYIAQLSQLDDDYRSGLAHCQNHTVISSHQALSYLSKRYNFSVLSISGLNSEEEPSPAKLAELSTIVKEQHITYVMFESLASRRLADTIATETGAKTLVFDPIERISHEAQENGQNYLKIQRANLANLRTALACN